MAASEMGTVSASPVAGPRRSSRKRSSTRTADFLYDDDLDDGDPDNVDSGDIPADEPALYFSPDSAGRQERLAEFEREVRDAAGIAVRRH